MSTFSPGSSTSSDSTNESAFTIILKNSAPVQGTGSLSVSFSPSSTGSGGGADWVPDDSTSSDATQSTAYTIVLKPTAGAQSDAGVGFSTGLTGAGKKGGFGEESGAGSNAKLVPKVGMLWGASPSEKPLAPGTMTAQTLTDLETVTGKPLTLVRFDRTSLSSAWIPSGSVPLGYINTGHTLVLTAKSGSWTWAQVGSGSADADLTARANELKTMGQPIFVGFHPEPDVAIAAGTAPGTAADYVAAFQRLVTVFRNVGATNVVFVWIAGGAGATKATWTSCYPGDAYVDWVASDPYGSKSTSGGAISQVSAVNATFLGWVTTEKAGDRTLPMMLGAWATTEDSSGGSGKQAFMTNALSYFKANPQIKAALYRNDSETIGTGQTATVYGTTMVQGGSGLTTIKSKYGLTTVPAVRVFAGNGLSTETANNQHLPIAGTLNSIDTKLDPTVAANRTAITNWAATLPNGTAVSWHHEPEGDMPAATFRSSFQLFHDAVKAGNPNVIVELCLMSWTVDDRSGTYPTNWQQWYPGDAYVDRFSWDFDGDAPSSTQYPQPNEITTGSHWGQRLQRVVQIASDHGKPWSVSEFGCAQASWDPNGTARAAFEQQWADLFKANGAQLVLYFDWAGVGGAAEPLQDTAEISKWSSIMASSGTSSAPTAQYWVNTSTPAQTGWQTISADPYTDADINTTPAGGLGATFSLTASGHAAAQGVMLPVTFSLRTTGRKDAKNQPTSFSTTFALSTTGQQSGQNTPNAGTGTIAAAFGLTSTGQRTTRTGLGQIGVVLSVAGQGHSGLGFPGSAVVSVVTSLLATGHSNAQIFRPPTVSEGPVATGSPLFSRMRINRGVTVVVYDDGEIKQVRFAAQSELQDDTVLEVYLGGHEYALSASQADALRAAGYGQYISSE